MKTSSCVNCRLGLTLVIALGFATTGCRSSTWKMPGSQLFSSREPDAATLAGKSGVPQLPESPASKYTPDNIAAVGKTPATSAATTSLATSSVPSSGYGYPTSASATSPSGSAAQGNGYQTGPYQVGVNAGLSKNGMNNTATTNTNAVAGALASGPNSLPSPYGGTYGGAYGSPTSGPTATGGAGMGAPMGDSLAPTKTTDAYPAVMASALPGGAGSNASGSFTASSYPALPNTAVRHDSLPSPGEAAAMPGVGFPPPPSNLPSMPSTGASTPNASGSTGLGAYPSPAVNSYTLGAAGGATTGYTAASANASSVGSYTPSASTDGSSAVGYAPGTTGRSTKYDFTAGGSGVSGGQASPTAGTSLPPNTAAVPMNSSLIR